MSVSVASNDGNVTGSTVPLAVTFDNAMVTIPEAGFDWPPPLLKFFPANNDGEISITDARSPNAPAGKFPSIIDVPELVPGKATADPLVDLGDKTEILI